MNGSLSPAGQALVLSILHFTWQGALIALGTWAALRLLRGSRGRYLAACLGLLAMPAGALLTFAIEWGALTRLPSPGAGLGLKAFQGGWPWALTPDWTALAIGPAVLWLWVVGVCLFAGWTIASFCWFQGRLGAQAGGPARGFEPLLERLRRELGVRTRVRLLASDQAPSPLTFGVFRPLVVMPVAALTGLAPGMIEGLLAHELLHIRRHDYLIGLFQAAVEVVLFYHPCVWWLSRRIRQLREDCCDDEIVARFQNPIGYARSLAACEALRVERLAVAATGGVLMRRIRRIVSQPGPSRTSSGWTTPTLLTLLAGLALWAFFACGTSEKTAPLTDSSAAVSEEGPKIDMTNARSLRMHPGERMKLDFPGARTVSVGSPSIVDVASTGETGFELVAHKQGTCTILVLFKDAPTQVLRFTVD